jgi:multidrug efflux pump
MSLSAICIDRPIATSLLAIGVFLAGALAMRLLPVAPLPQVDFPTIAVSANLPGASPETMAATVATPLERALGRIAGVSEITSESSLGSTRVTLPFDLEKNIDSARPGKCRRRSTLHVPCCPPRCPAIPPTARSTRRIRRS